ncbi:hypothetical protein EPR50_G00210860 [Perca flavescens]|uniref:Cystatin domain-containing protein n=1 Tax=Perca flavescens TaxID=8167 RepID=A0A484C2B6_PERFV|nr:hypothetical protein EPR50_G00210860 [Perca flavescens]
MMFVWFCVVVCAFTGRFVTGQSPNDGASQKVPVNDSNVLDAAQFAVAEFNKANTEELFDYTIVTITSAEIQVVDGSNYILELTCMADSENTAAADGENGTATAAADGENGTATAAADGERHRYRRC